MPVVLRVVIIVSDLLQAAGLRFLLLEYFDVDASMVATEEEASAVDTPSTAYIVSADVFCSMADFMIPRRARTLVVGTSAGMIPGTARTTDGVVETLRCWLDGMRRRHDETSDVTPAAVGADLTAREIDVLRAVAMGLTNKETADRLGISFNTVLSHRKNISAKLGIRSVSGLSVYAMMNGYMHPDEALKN